MLGDLVSARLFDLNIDKFLDAWEPSHALREVIANALDEQALTNTADVEIGKDGQGRWHVRDYGRGLSYEHLTQNESPEKAANADKVVGQFGVGLKDALATFERRGVQVRIRSRHGTITLQRTTKHGFDDVPSLHARVADPEDPAMVGTDVELTGITDGAVEAAKGYFLRFSGESVIDTTLDGQVLARGPGAGRVYLKGVRIAEEENFLFSYNITRPTAAMRKALNRERSHVGRTAYTDRVKKVLLACRSEAVADALAEEMPHLEAGNAKEEVGSWIDVQVHACKLLNPRSIFVTPTRMRWAADDIERARGDGLRVVVISDALEAKLHGQLDHDGKPMRLLDRYQRELAESYVFTFVSPEDMSPDERRTYELWRRIAEIVGKPPSVKEVLISETMRPEVGATWKPVGVWLAREGRVVILRSQLRNVEDFVGTLLHEFTHARTGAADATREFESGLTHLAGLLASKLLAADIGAGTGTIPGSDEPRTKV